jgi:hypothetical protein
VKGNRLVEAPMARKEPLLEVRVSHEVTRLGRQCMADAFERLLPVLERRIVPRSDSDTPQEEEALASQAKPTRRR